ncbi:M20/M25/M40 family metallo-hydrolase [Pelagicoccus albus]|uniref:M20/M25/M40 family metallo-hydrolase n=1 Tax=Pelagicoccus albus TaxID=415222 RepID=A0A7X1E9L8_9BACT|nr:M20/M25/M40 family metallo-hydrolase [Pelagicoccus albus]MBC2608000.1 M20/M25/M40 family metallo-hydrolase [Pelagicoccus albus]
MFDAIEKLKEYVSYQSVSADSAYKEGMGQTRDFVAKMLGDLGLSVEIVDTQKHPIVMARRTGDPSWPHVVIYGHYDVQPVDPIELWETSPFEATIKGDRIYGRGTADNKGPQMAHIAAVAELLEEHPDVPLRLTFIIEGEEEIGSPSLLPLLVERKEELSEADMVLLSDTLSPTADQIAVTVGLRGIVEMEFELVGPKSDLHSGLHGGAVYNPLQAMAEICASLHTADNRVNISGFYDDVTDVEDWEREELAGLGTNIEAYAASVGVEALHPVTGYTPFEAIRYMPTLEFNGLWGGYTGEGSKTIVPAKATVKITCRLVGNQKPDVIGKLVSEALMKRVPQGLKGKVKLGHTGVPYLVVPPNRPNTPKDQSEILAKAYEATESAVTDVFGKKPLFLREGGSIPIIADVKRVTGLDSVMIGLFLPEDNLHAPNESMSLEVLKKGIQVSKRILKAVAGV